MPFTLSHAAAAFPFRHTRLILSALIVGCFAPDFEYFIPYEHHGAFGHTLPGIFILDIPLSLLVLWLFHRYAKEPLAACLPASARARLPLGPRTLEIHSLSRFALLIVSILVGIATHILWDSFTHTSYWISEHLHFLNIYVELPLFGRRSIADILQYFSSAFGIVVLALWALQWYRHATPLRTPPDSLAVKHDRIALACSFLIALVVALIRAASFGIPDGVHGAQRFMTKTAVTGIAVFCFQIVIYGIVRHHTRNIAETA